ncbi:MAG: AAA family ATPase, partial [Persicimonas sp.]
LVRALEAQRRVRFTPDAVESILRLSGRFLRQEAFPGKAVRLTRQCFAQAVRHSSDEPHAEVRVEPERVVRVMRRQTGLPERLLTPGDGRTADQVRKSFERRVFGQPAAADAVESLVVATEQGVARTDRPLSSFLLIGPSGVGKTETAKALAVELFGGRDRLVRFDMSEFSEASAASRLIGTPQDPDGELTGRVRIQPYCVLLFDEIEKAHSSVLDLLLQLLDDGRLTDTAGRTVDFCNTVVLMTSNLGADDEERWVGFTERDQQDRRLHYQRAAEEFFRPEFFNRIDRVIPYQPLTVDTLRRIARRTLRELLERRGLRHSQVMVDVDRRLVEHLVGGVVDRRYGARTLAHRIEQRLITPLARRLASKEDDQALTRAVLEPGQEGEMKLDLRTLELASRQPAVSRGTKLFVERIDGDSLDGIADRLEVRIDYLRRVFQAFAESPQKVQIDRDYDEALAELNERASTGAPISNALAERVRQRELFRDEVRRFERDLEEVVETDGQVDEPQERDGFEEVDAARAHRLGTRLSKLYGRLIWLYVQMCVLIERDSDAATLVIQGLSGDFRLHLRRWRDWLTAFAEAYEVNLILAAYSGGRWREFGEDESLEGVSSIAVSAEHPGIAAAFDVLRGYMWAPLPPSHGHHGLLMITSRSTGASDNASFVDTLDAFESPSDRADEGDDLSIEFIYRDGHLEMPRLSRRLPVPEVRGAMDDFAARILFERLAVELESHGGLEDGLQAGEPGEVV